MFRYSHFRSVLAILLAFSLVSASLWSYGAEATADLLSDEMAHFSATGHHAQPDHESIGKNGANKPCNHGCHAQFHLAGAECHDESFSPIPPAGERFDPLRVGLVPTRPNEDPFRPPRSFFQA
ncbi:MAG: hypothetical protein KKE51_11780 [Gammaproteobacteria bacterium]|jgi:hypothetical protein|uniref:hypothetical protein n=1 Tax=Achromobacter ruhlandii TaxID=72557 RepID=UPI001467F1F8|nr:hypothetical protein [Achromobacter ruhlandii]MBI4997255.1 hypothetical protein [Rhodocyclales bacterium]MBU1364493.1 hypothetical protein [Gammaproteobacteria bacterium]MBU1601977.1 hypothetical protein [Gammaproteobacteria bacterium]MBU2433954.1 hypothetical protein [Gammaproteobacteria bacterium]MBU2447778.1 hypothetical protein [Gammaproteobacteria bacterium]